VSFLSSLQKVKSEIAARDADAWRLPLERLHGKIGDDGIERVTTQMLFDIVGVPQRSRGAGACRRLARLMAELGWSAVRVRGLTRGGYLEQVRGYCREVRDGHRSTLPDRDRTHPSNYVSRRHGATPPV
jgi:hypothetical protein